MSFGGNSCSFLHTTTYASSSYSNRGDTMGVLQGTPGIGGRSLGPIKRTVVRQTHTPAFTSIKG